MHLFKLTFIYLVAIISCTFLLIMDLPIVVVFLLLFMYVFALTMFPYLNTLFWSNNISKMDRFITKHKTKPVFAYPYAVAHKTVTEQKISVQKILSSYKKQDVQHNYRSLLATLDKDFELALVEAKQLQKEPIRSYTIAHIETLLGNFEAAKSLIPNLKKEWMPHAIEGLIAYEQHDFQTFEKEAHAATAKVRGLQKHLLFYSFKEMKARLEAK
ncbi:hypothetical protein BK128_06080 [Viridibacillus sp. FSL H7-0596]|uniref:hypothetical protein n=1 Tax=Viridibacillus sp. FSL H7-0596 TaxID=1928923 RepID=UPI00096DAD0E|nr:hypothetical protein [Viridibacillus sp. FSL H7-0596]OMC87886.1 hypothetical protein BK128_06080 [Viridibacillus sp. FSL H7-0596]